MRGAKINYQNKRGWTPLHFAIEQQLPDKMIQFLLSAGANPHIEDETERDCCDKVQRLKKYYGIPELRENSCQIHPEPKLKKRYDKELKIQVDSAMD